MSTRPLQNRANPDGQIVARPERGELMGNRGGRLHDANQRLGKRRWASSAWISCQLSFKGRHRAVMGKSYTELFFLDEATALAAGHRPCFECRRQDAVRFATLWAGSTPGRAMAADMDQVLHRERLGHRRTAKSTDLPDGALFQHDDDSFLVWKGQHWRWHPTGYKAAKSINGDVIALTPASIQNVLARGYIPRIHSSLS